MATETQTAEPKPAAPNGAPAAKEGPKAAKAKVAKKAPKPAAKKAAKAAPRGQRGPYSDDATIKVLKADHGLRGHRGEALDALLKDGQTIEKFKAALAKKGGRMRTYYGWAMKTALAAKAIRVGKA